MSDEKIIVYAGHLKNAIIIVMSSVYIRNAVYDYASLRPVIFELMEILDRDLIKTQTRVLIKPNLLAASPPDQAVITHPNIIKAVAAYVIEKGAVPVISDSPAVSSFERILQIGGIAEALKGMNVQFAEFKRPLKVDVGRPFNSIEISAEAMEADVLINLPKLKTHTQMLLTLGVKNLFGCILGRTKPEWHLRAGVDREMFATLLVRIFGALKPQINILDGILAMQGEGPGKSGEPRELGIVMGSDNAAALDITVSKMFGMQEGSLLTSRIAEKEGLVSGPITIEGELPLINDFKFPEMAEMVFGPAFFHNMIRKHLVQRPVCSDKLCRLCGECWDYCPAKAIKRKQNKLVFDYEKCIRCYCCLEVCPYGALKTYETVPGKLARKILKFES